MSNRLPENNDQTDLRAQIDAAQRIWEHRAEESKRAKKAETEAYNALKRLTNRAFRMLTRRKNE
jgi:hypothetical protein